ncbi:MFS transporter [Novosphingobium sp. 9]|uniref:MFS transporter n=1 Tax=Novosphingobium sp. 9 TaxID=2025349 RepID=UPI0021B695E6|nr:MFS transporter [Novosphingobium sp. 9]
MASLVMGDTPATSFRDNITAPEERMTAFQIAAVGLCVAINALDGFDVLAVAFTAPAISRDWGLGPAQIGGLFSAGLAGMGVGAFTISPLGDRKGRRPAILLCLTLLTVGMAFSALCGSLGELAAMRFITGLGIGGVLASINTVVAEYATAKRRSLAIACMALGYPIGATLGGLAAVPLIAAFGWHSVYVLGAILAAVMVPLVLWLLPESVQFLSVRRPVNALARINRVRARMNRAPLDTIPMPEAAQAGQARPLDLLRGPMLGATALVLLLNISVMATVYFTISWTPKILSQLGFSDSIGIYAATMMNLAGAIGCLLFGLLANRFGLRRLSIVTFAGMGLALTAFGLVPAEAGALIAAAFAAGFFLNTAITCLYTILPQVFAPATRATGTGIGLGGGRIGAVAGPYVAGLLMAAGWDRATYCLALAAPMLLAIVIVAVVPGKLDATRTKTLHRTGSGASDRLTQSAS